MIYRAARKSPIKQSDDHFSTVTDAKRAGSEAIKLFLSDFQDEVPELIKFGRLRRMPRTHVLLVLMVFLVELPPPLQPAPSRNPVTMDSLKADREKRETPEEAKRPWDGLYLTGPGAFEQRQPSKDSRAPALK